MCQKPERNRGWSRKPVVGRLAFCDSAGLASVQQEPDVAHSVVIVEMDSQWHAIDADVSSIVDSLPLSEAEKATFEFHAVKLFWGDAKLKLSRPERERIQRAFLQLIPKYSLPFVCGIVHKSEAEQTLHPYSFAQLGLTYEDVAFLFSIERLELFFRKKLPKEKALLISDESNVSELLERCIDTYRKHPLPSFKTIDVRFDHIVGLPLFTASHKSWGVQLADHVSFFVKREIMDKTNSRAFWEIVSPCLYDHRDFPDRCLKDKG
jgi:hypothetical protein